MTGNWLNVTGDGLTERGISVIEVLTLDLRGGPIKLRVTLVRSRYPGQNSNLGNI
jgi:hypothetical protein